MTFNSLCYALGAVACFSWIGQPQPVAAQSVFDIPDDCDYLAAHPADPMRVSEGLDDADIIPVLAMQACQNSLESPTNAARQQFQMARAVLASGNRQEALQWFLTAANSGSVIALVYLGDAEQFGWIAPPNPAKAYQYYQAAKASGLEFADIAIEQVTFDPKWFALPSAVEGLVNENVARLVSMTDVAQARAYFYSFGLEMTQICGRVLDASAIEPMYYFRFPAGWDPVIEEADISIGAYDFMASYDAEAFVERHGCEGALAQSLTRTLAEVFRRAVR